MKGGFGNWRVRRRVKPLDPALLGRLYPRREARRPCRRGEPTYDPKETTVVKPNLPQTSDALPIDVRPPVDGDAPRLELKLDPALFGTTPLNTYLLTALATALGRTDAPSVSPALAFDDEDDDFDYDDEDDEDDEDEDDDDELEDDDDFDDEEDDDFDDEDEDEEDDEFDDEDEEDFDDDE